jgi:hypothetical protein
MKRPPCQLGLLLHSACPRLLYAFAASASDVPTRLLIETKTPPCGDDALLNNTTGVDNTAIGFSALLNNIDGINNTAIGFSALLNSVNGFYNTAIGSQALLSNTSGAKTRPLAVRHSKTTQPATSTQPPVWRSRATPPAMGTRPPCFYAQGQYNRFLQHSHWFPALKPIHSAQRTSPWETMQGLI